MYLRFLGRWVPSPLCCLSSHPPRRSYCFLSQSRHLPVYGSQHHPPRLWNASDIKLALLQGLGEGQRGDWGRQGWGTSRIIGARERHLLKLGRARSIRIARASRECSDVQVCRKCLIHTFQSILPSFACVIIHSWLCCFIHPLLPSRNTPFTCLHL